MLARGPSELGVQQGFHYNSFSSIWTGRRPPTWSVSENYNGHWVGVRELQPARLPNLVGGVLLLYRYEDGLHAVRQSLESSEASITIQMHGCVTPTEEPPRSTVQPESYGQAGSSLGWRQFDMNTVAEGDPGYMA